MNAHQRRKKARRINRYLGIGKWDNYPGYITISPIGHMTKEQTRLLTELLQAHFTGRFAKVYIKPSPRRLIGMIATNEETLP